jgi:hypothetical protein
MPEEICTKIYNALLNTNVIITAETMFQILLLKTEMCGFNKSNTEKDVL